MKFDIEGYARGPKGQDITVTWEAVEMGEEAGEHQVAKNDMRRKISEAFPSFFGCDPEHIEVHISEHHPSLGEDG